MTLGARSYLNLVAMILIGGPSLVCGARQLDVTVNAESAILINAENGNVLFEKNVKARHYPASITKIATALYAVQQKESDLDEMVTAEQEAIASITPAAKKKGNYRTPPFWIEVGSNHIGIKKGEVLSLRALLYGMMVASANDASNVIAQHVGGGSISIFMERLNEYLKTIGCRDTYFLNPHGLHHPDHQTSARDMALMAQHLLKNQTLREIVKTVNYLRPDTNKQSSRVLVQTNRLLKKSGTYYYEKAIGIKIGYTTDALHTLVAAAEHEDRSLIAVVLRCQEGKDSYRDVVNLFETAFQETKITKRLLKAGLQKYELKLKGASKRLTTYLPEDVSYSYYPSEEPTLKATLQWKDPLPLPIHKGQLVGHIKIVANKEQLVAEIPLLADQEIQPTILYSFEQKIATLSHAPGWRKMSFISGISLILVGSILWLRRRKHS